MLERLESNDYRVKLADDYVHSLMDEKTFNTIFTMFKVIRQIVKSEDGKKYLAMCFDTCANTKHNIFEITLHMKKIKKIKDSKKIISVHTMEVLAYEILEQLNEENNLFVYDIKFIIKESA